MNFGGFNSAKKTPPSQSFSLALDISSPRRILVRNPSAPVQSQFPEILFRRNMRMGRVIRRFTEALNMFRERTLAGSHTSRSLHNPCVAKFDDPMTDGCQETKDFLA